MNGGYGQSLEFQPCHHPCDHGTEIWVLDNLLPLTSSCQVPHNHVIVICNLPCQFLQKVRGQAGKITSCWGKCPLPAYSLPHVVPSIHAPPLSPNHTLYVFSRTFSASRVSSHIFAHLPQLTQYLLHTRPICTCPMCLVSSCIPMHPP